MKVYLSVLFRIFILLSCVSLVMSGCYKQGYGCKGKSRSITGDDVRKSGTRIGKYSGTD